MNKKKVMSIVLAAMICASGSALASTEIHENSTQTNLVQRIRTADQIEKPQVKESIKDRIQRLMAEQQEDSPVVKSNLPKVAIMYVNNSKSTYDDEVDKEIFKYLNEALPESTYELVDGAPYIEMLNKVGYMDISMAERSDFIDVFDGSDIDYCIYLEVQPFIARDKMTFFTIGKDITTSVPFKILNLGTGKYIYNGKYTEKASDSTMIGGIGNKSVAIKALDSVGDKVLAEIQVRLPKTKSVESAE